ncbi:DEAD/DEAH box helicase [candidate division KSB3 bacterium]|uniref:DEAD/DEAH box helicase n=1 Tax=candidate division KSB3 bacterium TaxID=2044937 RepID=A0A9D5JTJ2_9BACT|nr:DEAD/DEAH box helicase [candidate division KSB3 bacterium]MBD3323994.1 DEAD/DEAH box helicase [candidate division KSB3 bacterium]
MTLHDLQAEYSIDPEILRIWTERESTTLLPIQEQAIRRTHILEGADLLVSAPTSSGKTFLAEIAAIHRIYQRQQVVYLLPLKALAEEKYADFSAKYREFGLDIVISTGDRTEFDPAIERGEFHVAILVFEKANRLLVRNKHFLANCGLIIIDEIQMTADFSRGSDLEMLLTAIRYAQKPSLPDKPSRPQVIALSAVIGDLNHLDEWLGLHVLMSDQRPVELKEGILRKDGTFTYRGFISKEIGTEQFTPLPSHLKFNLKSVQGRREYEYRRLQHYISDLVAQGEQVLIFRKWKGLTRETALRLARDLRLPPALDALDAIQEMEASISKEMLLEALRHGVAFHNADLGQAERGAIEQAFKASESTIRVICATSTLAMGINLPVNTVIIHDLDKPDPHADMFQETPISTAEYKNMSGRAGRLKQRDEGRAILFAETPAEEGILWRNYIEGSFPTLTSLLPGQRFLKETLFLVAADLCASEQEIIEFMRQTYAGTLYWQKDGDALTQMIRKVIEAIAYCREHELVTHSFTDEKTLRATEIGRICAAQGVAVETFVTLLQWLEPIDPAACDPWELLFLVLHNQELEELYVRLSQAAYESGEYWRAVQEKNPTNWEDLVRRSEELLQSRFEVTRRLKMSLLLLDWIAGVTLQTLELKYSQFYRDKSYSGVIRGLAENAAWMLRLLADVTAVRHADPAAVTRLQTLAQMVLFGVDERGIEIAALHVPGLTRTMIMALADAGYTREEHILEADLDDLLRILPRDIAFRLQDKLYRKYSRTETRHLVDQKLRLERLGYDTTLLKQVYAADNLEEFDLALRQMLQAPQLALHFRETPATGGSPLGREYTLDEERGTLFVKVLPPHLRELDEKQFGTLLTRGMRYQPAGFLVIGRPDFTEASYRQAQQFSDAYAAPLTLLPAYAVCERYVQALEGKTPFQLSTG